MNNRTLLYFAYLSLLVAFVSILIEMFSSGNSFFMKVADIAVLMFLLSGSYLLIRNGRFVTTNYYRITKLAIAFWILYALCKIMHWPFAMHLQVLGLLLIVGSYLLYVIFSRPFYWISLLKLLFVVTIFGEVFLKSNHWYYSEESGLISLVLLLFLLVDFTNRKKVF